MNPCSRIWVKLALWKLECVSLNEIQSAITFSYWFLYLKVTYIVMFIAKHKPNLCPGEFTTDVPWIIYLARLVLIKWLY